MEIKPIKLDQFWNSNPTEVPNLKLLNGEFIQRGLSSAAKFIEPIENEIKRETDYSLIPIINNVRQTITNYYSYNIDRLDKQIRSYEPKQKESPYYSRMYQVKRIEQDKLRSEYVQALNKFERDMQLVAHRELIGLALVDSPTSNFPVTLGKVGRRPDFIPHYSEFTHLNQQINSENSETTHERMQKNPSEWLRYHRLYKELSDEWTVKPYEVLIDRIKKLSEYWKIGDFGCGEAKIMETFGSDRVFSVDHIAITNNVTECNMRSVPLPSKSLDVIIFSLSLMGKNWIEYIAEAHRCLVTNGTLMIAETTNSLTEGRLSTLEIELEKYLFEIYSKYELGPFTFIEATKRDYTPAQR